MGGGLHCNGIFAIIKKNIVKRRKKLKFWEVLKLLGFGGKQK